MRWGTGLCPWNIALVQLLFNILFHSVRVFYICLLGFGIVFGDRLIADLGFGKRRAYSVPCAVIHISVGEGDVISSHLGRNDLDLTVFHIYYLCYGYTTCNTVSQILALNKVERTFV